MALTVIGLFLGFVFVITVVTQLIIPLWNDRPIFPIFNKRNAELEKSLKTLNALDDEQQLVASIKERTNQVIASSQERTSQSNTHNQ